MCGDLTGCFDFTRPSFSTPALPDAKAFQSLIDALDDTLPAPSPPPAGHQAMPAQDPGRANARPLPYQALANLAVTSGAAGSSVATVAMSNAGTAALQLNVLAAHLPSAPPQFVDVDAKSAGTASVPLAEGAYDVWVHGPNGFLRQFRGNAQTTSTDVEATLTIKGRASHPLLVLTITNGGQTAGRDRRYRQRGRERSGDGTTAR